MLSVAETRSGEENIGEGGRRILGCGTDNIGVWGREWQRILGRGAENIGGRGGVRGA